MYFAEKIQNILIFPLSLCFPNLQCPHTNHYVHILRVKLPVVKSPGLAGISRSLWWRPPSASFFSLCVVGPAVGEHCEPRFSLRSPWASLLLTLRFGCLGSAVYCNVKRLLSLLSLLLPAANLNEVEKG